MKTTLPSSRSVPLKRRAESAGEQAAIVTRRGARQTARIEELEARNAQLRGILADALVTAVCVDREGLLVDYSSSAATVFGLTGHERGRPVRELVHGLEDVDLEREADAVLEHGAECERLVRAKAGGRLYLLRVAHSRSGARRPDGVRITLVDVTAALHVEKQHRVLVAELNHRMRNMLQVVIGITNQALRRATGLQQFRAQFMGRMQALASAYELLSYDSRASVSLRDLLASQVAPFVCDPRRCLMDGENVSLSASAALALGMVLYELATNATKYGALSVPEGQVHICWRIEGPASPEARLILSWRERGGPHVDQPAHRGFGSELLQRELKDELDGRLDVEFYADGLEIILDVPARTALPARCAAR